MKPTVMSMLETFALGMSGGVTDPKMREHMMERAAPDVRARWSDLDREMHGRQVLFAWYRNLRRAIPNLKLQLREVDLSQPFQARVSLTLSGTPLYPLLAMFSVDRLFTVGIRAHLRFNRKGQVVERTAQLVFEGRLSVR